MESNSKHFFMKLEGSYLVRPTEENKHKVAEILDIHEYAARVNKDISYEYADEILLENNQVLIIRNRDMVQEKTELPVGIYMTDVYDGELMLKPLKTVYDQYLDLNNTIISELNKNIERFMELKEEYKRLHLLHKRGVLLYGPPGNGKSMIINHLVDQYKNQCYIIYIHSPKIIIDLNDIRELLQHTMVIFIFEEITDQIASDRLGDLLNFLDGPNSWDDCIIIATTNYPEKIPGNIINRPSRFDVVLQIDNPPENVRRKYLEEIIGIYPEQIISLTKDRSLAYLKELCVQALLQRKNLVETHYALEKMRQNVQVRFGTPTMDVV